MSQYPGMPHEFDSSPQMSAVPLRMTDDEARAVIGLWQQEQMDSPQSALPTPADMAEGLGIGAEDAVRFLAQVRSEREAARQAALAAQQEELSRAEAAAHLAELRARQAEAEARAAHARAKHLVPSHAERFIRQAPVPRISPPTADEWSEVAQREAEIRAQESRVARTGWIITVIAAVIGFAVACGLAGHVFSSLPH